MHTIRELEQQEKYNNMLKRKNKEIKRLNNIIKEVREYLKVREYETECCEVCDTMSNRILEILNKEDDKQLKLKGWK